MNLLGSNPSNPSTGELEELNDSVQISYDDLRIVNSKLIELEYEKEINRNLREVIRNDSTIILCNERNYNVVMEKKRKITRQRNISIGIAILAIIVSIYSFMK